MTHAVHADPRLLVMPDHASSERSAPVPADAELVARLAARDEAALAELYDRYSSAAFGLAARVCQSDARAEEVVQDCFLKLWRHPERFDPARASLGVYLMTLVRNASIDRLRRERPTSRLDGEDGLPLPIAAAGPGPAELAELSELAGRVRSALERLPEVQRRVVELAYFDGLSREEIAERTGAPVGTVKSRLKYALERMRPWLGGVRPDAVAGPGEERS